MSSCLWPHGLQHTRLPCPSLSPRVCSNSDSLSRWYHPTISSSATPFSFCLQSFPASPQNSYVKNPKLKCDGIRRQTFGGWLDREGGALQMGLIPLETSERCLAFPEVRTWWEESHLWRRKQTLARFWLCRHLGLGLPSLQNCEKEMLFKPLHLRYFVAATWMI